MTDTSGIIANLGGLSYLGIFGVAILANIFIPVPEEVTLLALGYVSHAGDVNIFIVIPIVIVGLLISDLFLYTLSHQGNRIVTFFYQRFFAKRIANKHIWVQTHIEKVIFYSRFLMQLRFIGPFMAGQLGVPKRKFITYELAALVFYVPLLLWIGWYFRSQVESIITGIGALRNLILIFIGIVIGFSILQSIYRKSFKQQQDEPSQTN
jgi:membrane protein DedA with SNARE-associated domain